MRRAGVLIGLAVLITVAGASPAAAQAWLPPQNYLGVTLFTQGIDHYGRILETGPTECCGTTNVALGVEVVYGVTDRLALSGGLPFVWSKYSGDKPQGKVAFLPYSPLDECHCTHGAWQDVRVGASYNLFRTRRTSITPAISFGTPTHAYEYSGEAAAGFGLKEMGLSVDVGQRLDMLTRGLSFEGGYRYAIVEQSLDISHNRSNAHIDVDYRFLRHFIGHGVVSWQRTHGGLRIPYDIEPYPELHTEFHRLVRDNYVHLGGGLTYRLREWELSGRYLQAVSGYQTHRIHVYSFTVSRAFRFGRRAPAPASSAPLESTAQTVPSP